MPDELEGEIYRVAAKVVRCPHCSNGRFFKGEAQLHTAGMTFLRLEWANRSATTLTCTQCSHIAWFLEHPEEVE